MNISGELTSSPCGFADLISKARAGREEGASKDLFTSIAAEEERQQQEAQPGFASFPGQMSEQDKSKVEMLQSRAEALAAQAEDGMTSGQESELRDIQKQIRKITKMPMGENIVEKAKDQAEARKAENQAFGGQDDPEKNGRGDLMPDDPDRLDMADQPGNRMLHQNAFVTSVKTAGASIGASSFKSRS